jgi:universal protein Kae1
VNFFTFLSWLNKMPPKKIPRKVRCLGIESTAHTVGIGIVDEHCSILANEKHMHQTQEGGLIPGELARHHYAHALEILEKALQKSGFGLKEMDAIAFSQGPGMGPALQVGALLARTLALQFNKPLIGINHCIAHVETGKALTKSKDPITVYASGGNTQIIGLENGRYRVFGETLDIGIGNLLDSFGRSLGMGFPAGPKIDELYFQSNQLVELPYSVKGMDLVFSGLLTAAEQQIGKIPTKNLAYSLMHTAFAMLTEVTERALAHTEKKEVLLVGGVAASKALQEMLGKMCSERKARLFVPPREACVDSGLLPAWQGLLEFRAGRRTEIKESVVNQRWRTDQVEADWV